ncbi:acyltransferase family protein [Treponema bryantii]|uniref:acyltransferase family protein n=1 Tax=Treponema bryantii TaxID=163 RepID=UPI0003B5227D|nr:acyltransferase [Treponema bryantii]
MNYNISLPNIPRKNAFTAIRIISALIVVYEHFVVLTNYALPCLELRGIAVNIFFFLSGFWVTRSFFTSKSIFEFYNKRIKKIFPAYLTVVFVTAILLVFMSSLDTISYFTDSGFLKYLIANISTLNFIHPDLPGVFKGAPVNGSLWTIKIELGFYIILPFILFLCFGKTEEVNLEKYRCLMILSIVYLLSVSYVVLIPILVDKYHLPSSIENQLPAFMSYFATGMLFFFYYEKILCVINKVVIIAIPIFCVCYLLRNNYCCAIFEPITLGVIIMWVALKARPLYIFTECYDFSYWLYLIHYPIIMVYIFLFGN